jgi:hypothetical protein
VSRLGQSRSDWLLEGWAGLAESKELDGAELLTGSVVVVSGEWMVKVETGALYGV